MAVLTEVILVAVVTVVILVTIVTVVTVVKGAKDMLHKHIRTYTKVSKS